ncbi:hypothetical protein DUNSADRAFT_2269 [Dunaliella salina]|uniref:Uncharacterized protein n=1 Tax=Dunaliella salina TaxID=3046 RepID=A0ABQ7FWI3_DUNSA|nr:hypothetical protein DUNSADRAFT_2269 [Dunaliella salina]|eukprot:KAF5826717.1 hypothetical protein DUNSADRAFT_2269 [Dunaliella salina]
MYTHSLISLTFLSIMSSLAMPSAGEPLHVLYHVVFYQTRLELSEKQAKEADDRIQQCHEASDWFAEMEWRHKLSFHQSNVQLFGGKLRSYVSALQELKEINEASPKELSQVRDHPAVATALGRISVKQSPSKRASTEIIKAGPKKLSQVKINPAIAAALRRISLKQSPSKPASTDGSFASGAAAAATPLSAPPSAVDLLGDDVQPGLVATTSHDSAPPLAQPFAPDPNSLPSGFDDLAGALHTPGPLAAGAADDSEWGEKVDPVMTATGTAPSAADVGDTLSLGSSPAATSNAPQPDWGFAPFVGAPPSGGAQPESLFAMGFEWSEQAGRGGF